MECYIPLDNSIPSDNVLSNKESHKLRKFVIFDEDLKIILHVENSKAVRPHQFSVWINDAKVYQSPLIDSFNPVDKDDSIWELKADICAHNLFRSSVVMNNGYNNQIKFCVEYADGIIQREEDLQVNGETNASEEEGEFLTAFEPVSSWDTSSTKSTVRETKPDSPKEEGKIQSMTLKYPIFSLLNVRLRNSLLKSRHFIISSLDFQTSKASVQFGKQFLSSANSTKPFQMDFEEVLYELVDRGSHFGLDPICPFSVPFRAAAYDSFSLSYKLPLIPGSSTNTTPHRVKITLKYRLIIDDMPQRLPIITTWETDVTLKRPIGNSAISQASSAISTPRLYGISPRMSMLGSTTSFVNNKLNNVKFKFINSKITVTKGEKFTMRLQIINSSSSSLDMVVYYNNKISPPNYSSSSLPLEKQYQLYKRYRKITEGIILLSNDYKVPIIGSNETYFVDLDFIGIMSGYYSTLSGLKIVDLETNELIEIGLGASVLVQ